MGAGCCITGTTEKETLKKSLGWASSWAHGLAKDLLIVQDCLEKIGGWGCCGGRMHVDHSPKSPEELESEIDSLKMLVGGLANKIRNSYFDNDDKESILVHLARDFKNIKAQCDGKIPIPVDGWGREDLFDEYSDALKTLGKPLHEKYVLAKIAGNGDFFRGMNAYEMYKNVDGQIEKVLNNGWNVGIDKNPDTVPLAILFQDKDAINMMSNRKYEFTLFDENERRKLVNISAMDRLLKKYGNARVFFLKDSVAEFDFYVFKKEQEEAEEKMKKSNDKIVESVKTFFDNSGITPKEG